MKVAAQLKYFTVFANCILNSLQMQPLHVDPSSGPVQTRITCASLRIACVTAERTVRMATMNTHHVVSGCSITPARAQNPSLILLRYRRHATGN